MAKSQFWKCRKRGLKPRQHKRAESLQSSNQGIVCDSVTVTVCEIHLRGTSMRQQMVKWCTYAIQFYPVVALLSHTAYDFEILFIFNIKTILFCTFKQNINVHTLTYTDSLAHTLMSTESTYNSLHVTNKYPWILSFMLCVFVVHLIVTYFAVSKQNYFFNFPLECQGHVSAIVEGFENRRVIVGL